MNQGMLCFDFETCQERKLECGITLMYRRPGIRCICVTGGYLVN